MSVSKASISSSGSDSKTHEALEVACTLVLVVSSLVLSKRVEKCAPVETDREKMQRQAIFGLSVAAIVLVVLKTLSYSVKRLSAYSRYANVLYFLSVVILSIVNIVYISYADLDSCTAAGIRVDTVTNKSLSNFVLILSILVLLYALKRVMKDGLTRAKLN